MQGLPIQLVEQLRIDPRTIRRIAPGYSGASVWIVDTVNGPRAIKRWPVGTTIDRIGDVHRLVQRTDAMPHPDRLGDQTWHVDASGIYDSVAWIDGEPIGVDDGPLVVEAAKLIAKFHTQVNSRDTGDPIAAWMSATSPTLVQRGRSIDDALKVLASGEMNSLRSHRDNRVRDAQLWIESNLEPILRSEVYPLQIAASVPRPTGWTLRDVHRQHILFHDRSPIAIIDPDAIRKDWPLIDLARWIGSFEVAQSDLSNRITESLALWNTGCRCRPVGDEAELIERLIRISTWLTFFQWTRWLWIEEKVFLVPRADQVDRWQFWWRRSLALQGH